MDLERYTEAAFAEHARVVEETRAAVAGPFASLVGTCATALRAGSKLAFFGNGGSAADAQHLAAELTVRFIEDRPAIAAVALTTDTSSLTAIGNDLGFDQLFARQIEALGKPGDVAIALTTSGESENVVIALERARSVGMIAAAFAGHGGTRLDGLADPLIRVPSATTARIQEMHLFLGHILCGALEIDLGLAAP